MKRIAAFGFSLLLILVMTGCAEKSEQETLQNEVNTVLGPESGLSP